MIYDDDALKELIGPLEVGKDHIIRLDGAVYLTNEGFRKALEIFERKVRDASAAFRTEPKPNAR